MQINRRIKRGITTHYASRQLQLFRRIFEIIEQKIRYPIEYTFDDPQDFECEFNEYLIKMTKIIKAMVRNAPQEMLKLVYTSWMNICNNIDNEALIWNKVEANLHLIYKIGEDMNIPINELSNEISFSPMIEAIIVHSVSKRIPHRLVL